MLNRLMTRSARRTRAAVSQPNIRARRLDFQALESRHLMAGIPALSSLPGAARTIFLDFDGDFQSVWNRTDSGQQYTNVRVGEFNIDNTAGISDAESAAIQKIWETVADDYAPFNVNVTTVAPASFANNTAMRVVMAGDCNATLRTSPTTTINVSGNRFIATNTGALVDTSGYAAINSYTNAEPNVVYVFAKYMSTWGTVDSEGHSRDLRAMIATTASHEAGHSFGLVHHGNYDVGTGITTPIMGSNTAGDRTIWSRYTVGTTTHDNVAKLTSVFGARPDEAGNSYSTARDFQFTTYSPLRGWSGTARGIIGTTGDSDMYRFSLSSSGSFRFNVTVPQFGNLDSQLVLYRIRPWSVQYYEQLAYSDPGISSITPFSGLGASFSANLTAGTYAVAVRSHGTYGDLGNYTLTISQPSYVIYDPVILATASGGTGAMLTSQQTVWATTSSAGVGQAETGASVAMASAIPAPKPILTQESVGQATAGRKVSVKAVDDLFSALSREKNSVRGGKGLLS